MCIAAAKGTAVRDLLWAAEHFALAEGAKLTGQLFLAGYSQGGHATLAAAELLQNRHGHEFTVTAIAPMAGPYDLSDTMLRRIMDEVKPAFNMDRLAI